MSESKPWYFSKTIWASLIAVAGAVLSAIGFDLDENVQADLTDIAIQFVTVTASIAAIFGRLAAQTRID